MLLLGHGSKDEPVEKVARNALFAIEDSNQENFVESLMKVKGIGSSKALLLAAALELGSRHCRSPQAKIKSPQDVIPYIQHYAIRSTEHFLTVTLNGAREILNIRVAAIGSGNMAILKTNDVFVEALKENASAVIFCHNHPSGSLEPSAADLNLTNRLRSASEILGIMVLDHIIISKNGYFSFMEHNLMEEK